MSARRRIAAAFAAFCDTQVSSRSLGLLRIFASTFTLYRLSHTWAGYHVDDWRGPSIASLVVLVCGFFVLMGYHTRIAATVLIVAFAVAHLYYGREQHLHTLGGPVFHFQIMLVLALTPCGRSLSIDRFLAVRRARAQGVAPPPERIGAWYLDLVALQLASMYLWAAMDKTDPDWLDGGRLLRTYMFYYGSSDSITYTPWIVSFAQVNAWLVLAGELALAAFLIPRRSRPWVLWIGILLHLGIFFLLAVTHFTMPVLATYVTMLPPQRVHEFLDTVLAE